MVELAQAEGVGRRSIERELHTLADGLGEQLGVDDQHGYSISVRSTGLNEIEALALYSAARPLQHTGVGERHYCSAMTLSRRVYGPTRIPRVLTHLSCGCQFSPRFAAVIYALDRRASHEKELSTALTRVPVLF